MKITGSETSAGTNYLRAGYDPANVPDPALGTRDFRDPLIAPFIEVSGWPLFTPPVLVLQTTVFGHDG